MFLLTPFIIAIVASVSADAIVHELDTAHVAGRRRETGDSLNMRSIEASIGQVDDVNSVYMLEPAVARVPEAGSQLMVHGESPFDNAFLLRDIPLFSTGHFGGSTFADRSALPAAAPLHMRFVDERLAGRYSGASGSVTIVDPGIITNDSTYKPRPQVLMNYGILGADLTLALPFRKNLDHYQLTCRLADQKRIGATAVLNYPSTLRAGYVLPRFYDDAQFLGEQKLGKILLRQMAWISVDNYYVPPYTTDTLFPWGAVAFSIGDTADSWHATIGGSRQYSYEGRQVGPVLPIKDLARNGVTMTISLPRYCLRSGALSTGVTAEYAEWSGAVERVFQPAISGQPFPRLADTASQENHSGLAGMGSIHAGYEGCLSFLGYGFDLNGGAFVAGHRPFLDPGAWLICPFRRGMARLSVGIISSQPDVRGLPSADYSTTLIHTCAGTLSLNRSIFSWLSGTIVGYVKMKDKVPVFSEDATEPIWDTMRNVQLLAYGAGAKIEARLGKHLAITSVQSIGKSTILDHAKRDTYQWDVPWSNATTLALNFLEGHMTLFCIGTFSAGMPYRDPALVGDTVLWYGDWKRMPDYKCVDLKLQYCQPIGRHRYLKQFDTYLILDNVLDLGSYIDPTWSAGFNAREYYWDSDFRPHQVSLKPFGWAVGVRIWLRL
jgi:hypothetical protein